MQKSTEKFRFPAAAMMTEQDGHQLPLKLSSIAGMLLLWISQLCMLLSYYHLYPGRRNPPFHYCLKVVYELELPTWLRISLFLLSSTVYVFALLPQYAEVANDGGPAALCFLCTISGVVYWTVMGATLLEIVLVVIPIMLTLNVSVLLLWKRSQHHRSVVL